jgi:capsular polysaccharide biosynthesis protein
VELEKQAFKGQVEMFNQASVIIASHGAGLTNIIFSRKALIFEFYPDTRPMNNPKNLQI